MEYLTGGLEKLKDLSTKHYIPLNDISTIKLPMFNEIQDISKIFNFNNNLFQPTVQTNKNPNNKKI